MAKVTVAATQFACGSDSHANIAKAEAMVRAAAARGANIVLLPELFEAPYFCKDQDPAWFDTARTCQGDAMLAQFADLAKELGVVLPVSFFERANAAHYNSIAIIDADGRNLGIYRKSHIPDGPGYQEKFYFRPGDTGFKTWNTAFGRIGVGICWDQWFPEAARAMALMGAELLFYPTAIGSEPQDAGIDSRDHWQRVMQGHAGANLTPLVASNRYGVEQGQSCALTFYGSSFIAGPTGEKLAEAERTGDAVLTATFDLDAVRRQRNAWGVFRDRRPELYGVIGGADGLQH
ncbi:MAG TPA: N-carbamoylputrescine amidase [Stellaceae bacterium]|jgi:N-carbamoylputrescine amidase|nr:N-carbamoylputrescine amidase [Stellaceae bacterium]